MTSPLAHGHCVERRAFRVLMAGLLLSGFWPAGQRVLLPKVAAYGMMGWDHFGGLGGLLRPSSPQRYHRPRQPFSQAGYAYPQQYYDPWRGHHADPWSSYPGSSGVPRGAAPQEPLYRDPYYYSSSARRAPAPQRHGEVHPDYDRHHQLRTSGGQPENGGRYDSASGYYTDPRFRTPRTQVQPGHDPRYEDGRRSADSTRYADLHSRPNRRSASSYEKELLRPHRQSAEPRRSAGPHREQRFPDASTVSIPAASEDTGRIPGVPVRRPKDGKPVSPMARMERRSPGVSASETSPSPVLPTAARMHFLAKQREYHTDEGIEVLDLGLSDESEPEKAPDASPGWEDNRGEFHHYGE